MGNKFKIRDLDIRLCNLLSLYLIGALFGTYLIKITELVNLWCSLTRKGIITHLQRAF